MKKVGFTLETVTPLFLSGNDQNSVELRAASIRGHLRYWYRALLGGLGIIRPDQLHELESRVFGKEEQGSPVLVRIKDIRWAGGRIKQNKELDLGYDQARRQTRRPGLTYLLYSTQLGGNERPYADVGTTFTLELSSFNEEAEKLLKLTACALWCWTHFGGLGTRARRGGGNVQVKGVSDEQEIFRDLPAFTMADINTVEALKSHLESGLRKVRGLVAELNKLATKTPGSSVDFPILHPNHADIWIIRTTWKDALSAMEEVGKKFQQFRHKRNPDFPSVLNDYLNAGRSPTLERPAFGLPLQFRYRSAPHKQAMVETQRFTRRASPLLFRFLKLGDGRVSLVLLHFRSSFLPSGEMLKIKDQSKGPKQKPQFLNPPTAAVQQGLTQQFRDQFGGHLDVRNWL
ncbi:MAG: type III-B CRISPR module RAMP protein Cmr1 [Blastocatellia bacterium]|nr:type III-B CRISPR module RAMP protein Cmr1 [Blastocatellia bacterium]MCS7157318.1 type III-B CRISPR module RAMP protein Cmr1 [Blastocatellia bacterium]MCX7753184.1 type III-B CRISPR module RAMP protein Cmr1 [Blastocatellia bacterium]MDW8168222.1 type III-B CRISPR module RAMP protein Cmr1 [Acidobacteriota bacterium]MDW8255484.1 type III-B CRISPR module RAMP protein Cmr1 [Acidobacteriota bacterium]